MSRYRVISEWTDAADLMIEFDPDGHIAIEVADIRDIKSSNQTVYRDGAYRVLVDGKAVRGKGGTHPFFGEMAWADAARLARDETIKAQRRDYEEYIST